MKRNCSIINGKYIKIHELNKLEGHSSEVTSFNFSHQYLVVKSIQSVYGMLKQGVWIEYQILLQASTNDAETKESQALAEEGGWGEQGRKMIFIESSGTQRVAKTPMPSEVKRKNRKVTEKFRKQKRNNWKMEEEKIIPK